MRKTAISVPEELLAQIDRVAKARGESRSRFIQRVFAEAIRARSDEQFACRLNDFFSDHANVKAYGTETASWPELPPSWKAERW